MLAVFCPSLVVNEDVDTPPKSVLVNGHRISYNILMKVVGEFFKTKGMTNHSKRPSFELKVVFHTFVCCIGTW
jgi:hypothetical protein